MEQPVAATSSSPLVDRQRPSPSPVVLHIYDLDPVTAWLLNHPWANRANLGMYHCGVEVHGSEYCFQYYYDGWEEDLTGVFQHKPGRNPLFRHRCSLELGTTTLSRAEVREVIDRERIFWPANSYHLIGRNCVHFAEEFVSLMRVQRPVPRWVSGLGRTLFNFAPLRLAVGALWLLLVRCMVLTAREQVQLAHRDGGKDDGLGGPFRAAGVAAAAARFSAPLLALPAALFAGLAPAAVAAWLPSGSGGGGTAALGPGRLCAICGSLLCALAATVAILRAADPARPLRWLERGIHGSLGVLVLFGTCQAAGLSGLFEAPALLAAAASIPLFGSFVPNGAKLQWLQLRCGLHPQDTPSLLQDLYCRAFLCAAAGSFAQRGGPEAALLR